MKSKTYKVVVKANGDRRWYFNGKLHREKGPAVIVENGDQIWYVNGMLHRLNGPAVDCSNGYSEWWINGKRYSEKEFKKIIWSIKSISLSNSLILNAVDI